MNPNTNQPKRPDWEKLLTFLEQEERDESVLSIEEKAQLSRLKKLLARIDADLSPDSKFDSKAAWENIKDRLIPEGDGTQSAIPQQNNDEAEKIPPVLWPRIIGIAAAVALIILGVYFFRTSQNGAHQNQIAYKDDVKPGKQGATLTLANGKQIVLNDAANGELAEQAGVTISKTADGKLIYELKEQNGSSSDVHFENTLSTAKGETYQLRLPDGSLVWLNAASSLTYSAALNERRVRRVRLVGEGYFEVAKNVDRPFIVETERQKVEVLGTHFNVNAYADELIARTTLLEGSVRVTEGKDLKLLVPGQQALNTGRGLQVVDVDTDLIVAWKNNNFIFERLDIHTIMRMIERWYNVEVVFEGEVTSEKFWGSVSRFDNVSRVLSTLESTGNVHFRVEGRRIYVSP